LTLKAIQLSVLCALLLQSLPARTPCREPGATVKLLREVVVPKWTTITKVELLRRWPGLQVSPSIPDWPASLIGNAGNPYCKESFTIQQRGGVTALNLFFSGTRDQVLEAAPTLSAALRFPLGDAEKRQLEQEDVLLLRQMGSVPPRGLDIDVIKNLDGNAADWGVRLQVTTFGAAR
jgi:hypothetical protein